MRARRDRGRRPCSLAPEALDRGARFLLANQGGDGFWRDFDTPAGEASVWPTAFVATALQSAGVGPEALERAAGALTAAQNDDGGWGYNEATPSDADSTAWALLFLARTGSHGRACRRAVACLARHQRGGSGGVATYAERGPIRRFMGVGWWMPFWGWCRSHTEVTAVAGRALMAYLADGAGTAAEAAWRFVQSQQTASGCWTSYWWLSPHYTTAQAVELATARGERAVVDRAADWVLRGQAEAERSAFVSAMALSILVDADTDPGAIERVVEDVAGRQEADGGWPAGPILRIPVPAETDPAHVQRGRVVRFAGGMEVSDQHRLFTTAACVAALAR